MKKKKVVKIAVIAAIVAIIVAVVVIAINGRPTETQQGPTTKPGPAITAQDPTTEPGPSVEPEKVYASNKYIYLFDGYEKILMFDEENPNAVKCKFAFVRSNDIRILTNIKDLTGDEALKKLQGQEILYYVGSIADWSDPYLCGKDPKGKDPATAHGIWRPGKLTSLVGTFDVQIIRDEADMPATSKRDTTKRAEPKPDTKMAAPSH